MNTSVTNRSVPYTEIVDWVEYFRQKRLSRRKERKVQRKDAVSKFMDASAKQISHEKRKKAESGDKKCTDQIQHQLRPNLVKHILKLKTAQLNRQTLSRVIKETTEEAVTDFDSLHNNSMIDIVRISDKGIIDVVTHSILIEAESSTYEIGAIEISCDPIQGSIRIHNILNTARDTDFDHPIVYRGRLCVPSSQITSLVKLMGDNKYLTAIEMVIGLLQFFDMETAIVPISNWKEIRNGSNLLGW